MTVKTVGDTLTWMKDVNRRLRRLERARNSTGTSVVAAMSATPTPTATRVTLPPGTILQDNADGTFTVVDLGQDSDDTGA